MKQSLLVLIAVFCISSASAQNLGEKFDWLKLSYTKIPLRSGRPFYDTVISYGNKFSTDQLHASIKYYFDNVISSPAVDTDDQKFSGKGSYTIYTDSLKDEEHTYTVNYTMEIALKDGKYEVAMHDFDIYYLTNKVEFFAKFRRAESNDGRSNYFMALFNDKNILEIRKVNKVLALPNLPETATAGN